MRPFGETLPTMSDTAGSRGEPSGAGTAGSAAAADFGPNAILKALNARSVAPARGAQGGAGGRAAARHTAFDPAQLPRKTATGLARTPFARELAAAIEPFDASAPKSPAPATSSEAAQPEPGPSERERIADEVRAEERRRAAVPRWHGWLARFARWVGVVGGLVLGAYHRDTETQRGEERGLGCGSQI